MFLRKKNSKLFLCALLANIYYSPLGICDFIPDYFSYIPHPKEAAPWFTGPLLAPSANIIPPHHINIEPYIYFKNSTASYDAHWNKISHPNVYSIISQTFIQVGVNSFMDFQVVPQLFYTFTQGASSAQVGDLLLYVDFQLSRDRPNHWIPSTKLSLTTSCPSGKYQKLKANKLGVDGTGSGSWNPTVALDFSELFVFSKDRFLNLRWALNYTIPNPVSIKGFNIYGGASDTKGTAYPGNAFSFDIAIEYTLSQNWTFATDLYYVHKDKRKFSGNPGTLAIIEKPSSEQISLAPAIEYSWSPNLGLITGAWFTLAGRNSDCFWSSVTAVNIYF